MLLFLFYRSPQSKCLDDEPARSKREDIEEFENPGRIHDPDIQCKYKFGDDAQSCFNDHVSLIMLLDP